jgi:CDGSH-type Zn-finger protein
MSENAAKVTISANGPYGVSGDYTLVDANGEVIEMEPGKTAWLCRCGQSANKPFCDGSHKKAGFTDPGTRSDA